MCGLAVVRPLLVLHAVSSLLCASTYTPPTKYLIISNARNGTIGYAKVPKSGRIAQVNTLIDTGLGHPQGIAVDQKRQLLLVADSELRKVVSYGLTLRSDGSLAVDEQTPVAEDVEARWVAVDGPGNVYFSEEQGSKLLKVSARQVLDGDTTPSVIYPPSSADMSTLSAPGGLAVDNFHVYWANKVNGDKVGTIIKGLEVRPNTTGTSLLEQGSTVLARNLPKAYGVCLAIDNVFYTSPDREVYVVKTGGGSPVTVTGTLQNPRGCAWDGDATVYIADRGANGVYAIPGPMVSLAEAKATKVAHFEDAFGVAVFSSAPICWRGATSALLALLLLLSLAEAA